MLDAGLQALLLILEPTRLLIMTGGILGAFASLDLFFFYFLHELALVPTFIMIGVWGRGVDAR